MKKKGIEIPAYLSGYVAGVAATTAEYEANMEQIAKLKKEHVNVPAYLAGFYVGGENRTVVC